MWSNDEHLTGTFRLIDGREVSGSLHICGEDSNVVLFDDAEFQRVSAGYAYIMGELHDGRLVTLLQCTLLCIAGRSTGSDRRKHSVRVFPHYVTIGPSHISPSTRCIARISFVMKDASARFYDLDVFSTVLDPKPFVPLLQEDKAKFQQVEIGEHPIIDYFTGKFDIAVVDTARGEVRAHHDPIHTLAGPQGVRIDKEVVVTLTPPDAVTFQEAVYWLSVLLRFFELVLDREQPLIALTGRLLCWAR